MAVNLMENYWGPATPSDKVK